MRQGEQSISNLLVVQFADLRYWVTWDPACSYLQLAQRCGRSLCLEWDLERGLEVYPWERY